MSQDKTNTTVIQMRHDIAQEAGTWVGSPFRHQGRNRRGIDCVGLIIEVGKSLGYVSLDYKEQNYPRRSPHSGDFVKYFINHLARKRKYDMDIGDIVILKEPIFPCHCGIIGERENNLTLIHSHAPRKKVVEEFFYPSGWEESHMATFKFEGV